MRSHFGVGANERSWPWEQFNTLVEAIDQLPTPSVTTAKMAFSSREKMIPGNSSTDYSDFS